MLPDIKNTRWKKKTDFYSLFVYLAEKVKSLPLSDESRKNFRNKLDEFATGVSSFLSTDGTTGEFSANVQDYAKSIRASSDLGNRKRRHVALAKELDPIIHLSDEETKKKAIEPSKEDIFSTDDSGQEE